MNLQPTVTLNLVRADHANDVCDKDADLHAGHPYKGTAPVANYYWNQQRLIVLDGLRDYKAVEADVRDALTLQEKL